MNDRKYFAEKLSHMDLSRVEQAIAFLWFYRYTQSYEERTASELASDLTDEGFGRPNVTDLHRQLTKSRKAVKGKRPKTFQLYTKYIAELNTKFGSFVNFREVEVTSSVIPFKLVQGTRAYLERIVNQINGAYDYGFYDCCAAMCRRLMESLIIEVYISSKRHHEIQNNSVFIPLEQLISHICSDKNVTLNRNAPKTMKNIKQIGDTATHDRVYITQKQDINDHKHKYRCLIEELLILSKIKK